MTPIGKVNMFPKELDIEWEIKDFFSLLEESSIRYYSSSFSFDGEFWHLGICPNGKGNDDSVGYINLHLYRTSLGPPITLDFSLALKTENGQKVFERFATEVFQLFKRHELLQFISRSELKRRESELVPSGVLTIVCSLRSTKAANSANDRSLCQNYKNMLLDGLNHDLILKVRDKELKAHRDVLRARSQVLKSMLSHDMEEKNSGVIEIPDCDPQAMEQFLFYVYSGKVDALETNNMLELYYIADKYDIKELKEECSFFIKKSLTFTNICEVVQLALNHCDSSLLEYATDYFINNVLEIMNTIEWQTFMKDNSTVANELTIKSIKMLKNV